jgi:LmbE family N-acetylglucosaminyl deacetylase
MNVLGIGAHPDDVELGCGATLAAHAARGDNVALLVMTTGEQGPQAAKSRIREQEEAAKLLGVTLYWGHFRDGAVPAGRETVQRIDAVLSEVAADIVYTHSADDTHQDHRVIAAASLAASRRTARVLMYEAPTSRDFVPSLFVDVGDFVRTKLAAVRAHQSQVLKNKLVDLEAIEAQARWRGFQARLPHGYAEGFSVERFAWDLIAHEAAEGAAFEDSLVAVEGAA